MYNCSRLIKCTGSWKYSNGLHFLVIFFLDFVMAHWSIITSITSTRTLWKSVNICSIQSSFSGTLQFTMSCCLGHILLVALSRPPAHRTYTLMSTHTRWRAVNTWKATGPHGVSDRVLECAEQLTRVTTNVFNWSLSQICHHRPNVKNPLLRASMNSTHSSHCKKLGEAGPPTLDRHQFAYRANIFTGEAIITALHTAIPHLGAHQVGLCQTALRRF